jgi:hypothetical protein
MMSKWLARTARFGVAAAILAMLTLVWGLWCGNRRAAPVSEADKAQAFQQAVGWFKAHESQVLQDGNAALWWMVQTAAERTHDPYLASLVRRSLDLFYPLGQEAPAWKRMVDPRAVISDQVPPVADLAPYQRFFIHALTCRPVQAPDGDTSERFLTSNTCRPLISQVFRGDTVCSTHQLMGLQLIKRSGCETAHNTTALESALIADIQTQLKWDFVVKDAYIQRVLMLAWVGHTDALKPVWLQRVLAAQQPDGGWLGRPQFPELPLWLQPHAVRRQLASLGVWHLQHDAAPVDFHASAQGLLLVALALESKPPVLAASTGVRHASQPRQP